MHNILHYWLHMILLSYFRTSKFFTFPIFPWFTRLWLSPRFSIFWIRRRFWKVDALLLYCWRKRSDSFDPTESSGPNNYGRGCYGTLLSRRKRKAFNISVVGFKTRNHNSNFVSVQLSISWWLCRHSWGKSRFRIHFSYEPKFATERIPKDSSRWKCLLLRNWHQQPY